jgi:hypothetical protein
MTAHNWLYLIAIICIAMTLGRVHAENDVTVLSTPETVEAPPKKTASSDGTPVIHKSLHKKKHTPKVAGNPPSSPTDPIVSPTVSTTSSFTGDIAVKKQTPPVIISTTTQPAVTITPDPASLSHSTAPGLTVETGLPVARYPGVTMPFKEISTLDPGTAMPNGKMSSDAGTHHPLYASLPSSVIPAATTAVTTYSLPARTTSPSSDFVFTNFKKSPSNRYPWKTGIITTMFWIGEGGSNISPTNNVASAWDENWRSTNRGPDNPNDRNGFASAGHASTVNPFYVALPFNDLAFPDKARLWVPRSWHRLPKDGKQVSACQHRWVWIKNADGRSCFAQWEDVGPLRYDHAEYVFGDERPTTYTRAGLDVSPAVADYLGINEKNRAITSWRFVDDADVPPGQWLKYDEQAVIFTALHQLKSFRASPDLPIQRATEPIDDQQDIDSNKKKVGASKG